MLSLIILMLSLKGGRNSGNARLSLNDALMDSSIAGSGSSSIVASFVDGFTIRESQQRRASAHLKKNIAVVTAPCRMERRLVKLTLEGTLLTPM